VQEHLEREVRRRAEEALRHGEVAVG
jgi:hypothetical protein